LPKLSGNFPESIDYPLKQLAGGIGNFCKWHIFVKELPKLSYHLPESIDYPLKQLAEGIGNFCKWHIFVRGLPKTRKNLKQFVKVKIYKYIKKILQQANNFSNLNHILIGLLGSMTAVKNQRLVGKHFKVMQPEKCEIQFSRNPVYCVYSAW
jgi:hypothetical protein